MFIQIVEGDKFVERKLIILFVFFFEGGTAALMICLTFLN